jgi:hypothetical protein
MIFPSWYWQKDVRNKPWNGKHVPVPWPVYIHASLDCYKRPYAGTCQSQDQTLKSPIPADLTVEGTGVDVFYNAPGIFFSGIRLYWDSFFVIFDLII